MNRLAIVLCIFALFATFVVILTVRPSGCRGIPLSLSSTASKAITFDDKNVLAELSSYFGDARLVASEYNCFDPAGKGLCKVEGWNAIFFVSGAQKIPDPDVIMKHFCASWRPEQGFLPKNLDGTTVTYFVCHGGTRTCPETLYYAFFPACLNGSSGEGIYVRVVRDCSFVYSTR
ncbi:MAG: hypothetical protein GXN93_01675 [Candidatus Diapherotrites archaeon]|nr:hypothetical protein [Candidatus Diapherotrites archaeon]